MRRRHSQAFLHYPKTLGERFYSLFVIPLIGLACVLGFLYFIRIPVTVPDDVTTSMLILATLNTLYRLVIAYVAALICAIPLSLLATYNSVTEKIFLPIFDIIESVPVLAFFPIFIIFFIRIDALNTAAIFILFLAMLWNIVFTVVGGLKLIPQDIHAAAKIFNITGFRYFREVMLPAIFPEIVTGSILAFAQGWNLIIVAEAIHTYLPHGVTGDDLFGIGSILVNASSNGQTSLFVASLVSMIVAIGMLNYFVWQKLIHYAQQFRFE